MALKQDTKPMMPAHQVNRNHVQCADHADCKKPGRLWFLGMLRRERVCVDHAAIRFERGERDEDAPR